MPNPTSPNQSANSGCVTVVPSTSFLLGFDIRTCETDYGLLEGIYPSPDGKMIAIANNRFQIMILDANTFKEILEVCLTVFY